MGLTSTDYIGIGVLITTATTGIIQIINTVRLKAIDQKVDGAKTAQETLIATLHEKLGVKDLAIADAKQTAAVLAAGANKDLGSSSPIPVKIESPSPVPVKMTK